MTTPGAADLLIARTTAEALAIRDEALRDFAITRIPWSEVRGWTATDHAISHETGGFFDIAGVESAATGAQYVMLHQVQSGLTALVRHRRDRETYFLVQARQEPGALNGVQFAPTVQSTPANYLALHGGKASDYVRTVLRYSPTVRVLSDSFQVDIGLRYQGKTKRAMIVDTEVMLETAPGFVWIAGSVLASLTDQSGLLNADLRTLMTISPWGSEPGSGLVPVAAEVRRSLDAPPRADVVAGLIVQLGAPEDFRHIPFGELRNWDFAEDGLREREPDQGFAVEFYSIEAPGREVASWTQPLVNSSGMGRGVLLYRIRRGVLEIAVTVVREHGLVAGAAVAPSQLSYPGEPGTTSSLDSAVLGGGPVVATLESDEGGRFFQDVSNYITRPAQPGDDLDGLVWITVSELKLLLHHSTAVTMQLRSHASQLLSVQP